MQSKIFYIKDSDTNFVRKINYYEWGKRLAKPIICVHGLTRNGRDFDYLANELSKNFWVLCPDIAGRGKSDNLNRPENYHNSFYANDMISFINHLGLSEVGWIGTSMGGLIAMDMIAKQPNLIKNLVLNDVGPFIDAAPLKKIAKYISIMPEFENLKLAKDYLKVLLASFGIKEENDWDYIVKNSFELKENKYIFSYDPKISENFGIKTLNDIQSLNLWDLWKKINCNVLVLQGEFSEILTDEVVQKMLETKPSIKHIKFENIGHAPSLMDFAQIKIINDWFLEH